MKLNEAQQKVLNKVWDESINTVLVLDRRGTKEGKEEKLYLTVPYRLWQLLGVEYIHLTSGQVVVYGTYRGKHCFLGNNLFDLMTVDDISLSGAMTRSADLLRTYPLQEG